MPGRLESIPTLFEIITGAAGLLAMVWAWIKRIRPAISKWRRERKARREQHAAMLATWPSVVEGSSRNTQQFTALSEQIESVRSGFDQRLDMQDMALENIQAQLWAARRFSVQAEFQCDHTGKNVQVNAAYATLMRVGEFDLLGYGWKNRLVEEDRLDYEATAQQAFREHRKFERTVRFQRGDGTRFLGRVRLEPHPEDPADLPAGRQPLWFGSVTMVEEVS